MNFIKVNEVKHVGHTGEPQAGRELFINLDMVVSVGADDEDDDRHTTFKVLGGEDILVFQSPAEVKELINSRTSENRPSSHRI